MSENDRDARLPEKLVSKLACPKCKGLLDYGVSSDRLNCNQCRLSFGISEGVPVLLLDEAQEI